MNKARKSTSPIVDALRLFFRNPSAVVALLLIAMLATAATTGKVFTGTKPTIAQHALLEEADELGDSVDLGVNRVAVMDPNQTMLRDKFLPPGTVSKMSKEEWQQKLIEATPASVQDTAAFKQQLENVEPKTYWLGTDHLGRDVLAQLWAGSSISLTIGFLSVGISVFLGVTLGGIAGFFGRRPVRLPMLIMLLFALMGGIAIPAEAPTWGWIFFSIAAVAFGFQLVVAVLGKRYKPVIGFGVVAALVASVFLFNWVTETRSPEGRVLQQARIMETQSRDVLLMTRDLGRDRKKAENKEPGHRDEAWFTEQQLRLDVAYRNLSLELLQYELVEYLSELEKDARLGQDMVDRADHLDAHVPSTFNDKLSKDEVKALPDTARREHTKYANRKNDAAKARETGRLKVARATAVAESIKPWIEGAQAAIEAERETMKFVDFDFQNHEARINKLLAANLALTRAKRATDSMKFAETLHAAANIEGGDTIKLAAEIRKALQDRKTEIETSLTRLKAATDKSEADKQAREKQIKTAEVEVKGIEDALTKLADLKEGDDNAAWLTFLTSNAMADDAMAAALRAAFAKAEPAVSKPLTEAAKALGTPEGHTEEAIKARERASRLTGQAADLAAAARHAAALTKADTSIASANETVTERLTWILKPVEELSADDKKKLDALNKFDYTANSDARDPYFSAVESSEVLLNRRADLRATFLKRFEADAKNRFDGNNGLLEAKLQDGSYRYQTYRITRHFITITILILLLVVAAMIAAAAAQGAAEDIKGPLSKAFIPTISVDDLVMRFTEIMLTIPTIYLILAVLALFQKDVYIVMAVIGLTSWMGTTRFVRAEILSLREQDFVQAARALGVSDYRIIWRHLVPNAISPVLVSATIGVATAVLAESTLSFLGIGAAPDQPTWGQILSTGRAYITDYAWLTWIPGIAILITVLSFNLLGEGLREAFNPKLRGR